MAISRVQKKAGTKAAAGTSLAITMDSGRTAGSVLYLLIKCAGASGASAVSSTGDTWTKDKENAFLYDLAAAGVTQLWRGVGGTGNVITATVPAVTAEAEVFEASGVGTGAPEQTASGSGFDSGEGPSGSTVPVTGTTAVNSTSNTYVIGACGITNLPNNSFTPADNLGEATQITWTTNSTTLGFLSYEGIETATAAMNGVSTWGGAAPLTYALGGVIGVYAEAAAAASTPTRTLMGVGL